MSLRLGGSMACVLLWGVVCAGCAPVRRTFRQTSVQQEEHASWRRLASDDLMLTTSLDQARAREAFLWLETDLAAIRAGLRDQVGMQVPQVEVIVTEEKRGDTPLLSTVYIERLTGNHPLVVLWAGKSLWVSRTPSGGADSGSRSALARAVAAHLFPGGPDWLLRGLEAWLAVVGRDGDDLLVGGINDRYLSTLRDWVMTPSLMPAAQVLTASDDGNRRFAASAWLLVHYLVNAKPVLWRAFLGGLARGEQPDQALMELEAGLDLEHLDAALRDYATRGKFSVSRVPLQPPREPEALELSVGEFAWTRGKLLLRESASQVVFREGLDLEPGNERLRLEVLWWVEEGHLKSFLEEWLEAAPENPIATVLQRVLGGVTPSGAAQALGALRCESLAARLNDKQEYDAALRLALEVKASSPALYRLLGVEATALAGLGRWDEAVERAREAVRRARLIGRAEKFELQLAALERHELPKP